MRSYCVKQKKVTECVPGSERYVRAKNDRLMMKCICQECKIVKTRFVKQTGNGSGSQKMFYHQSEKMDGMNITTNPLKC